MSNAKRAPRQSVTGLPSITELWREVMILNAEHDRLCAAASRADPKQSDRFREAASLIFEREYALRDLATSLPAQTISDAAVQVELALSILDDLDTCEFSDREARQRHALLTRLLSSVHPQVAQVAGMSLSEIGGDWAEGRFGRAFPCPGAGQ